MVGKVQGRSQAHRRSHAFAPASPAARRPLGDQYHGADVLGRGGAGPSVAEVTARARAARAQADSAVVNPSNGIMVKGGGIVFPASYHPKAYSAVPGCSQEQCAEWVHDTFAQAGKPLPFGGNGNQYWPDSAGVPGYSRIPNGSGQAPEAGDILCFGGGAYGHVAIVTKVSTQPPYVEVGQANWGSNEGPGVSHRFAWNPATGTVYSGDGGLEVQGFIRPDAAHSLITPDQRSALAQQPLDDSQGAFDGVATSGVGAASQGSGSFSVPAGQTGGPSRSSYSGRSPSAQITAPMAAASAGNIDQLLEMLAMMGIDSQYLDALAAKYHVPKNLILAIIMQESGGDPRALSSAGAAGLMQLMPQTAKGLVDSSGQPMIPPSISARGDAAIQQYLQAHPKTNLECGVAYLGQLLKTPGHQGDVNFAIQAYNAGPAGNFANSQTRTYLANILAYKQALDAKA